MKSFDVQDNVKILSSGNRLKKNLPRGKMEEKCLTPNFKGALTNCI